jgi:hypothetical protein
MNEGRFAMGRNVTMSIGALILIVIVVAMIPKKLVKPLRPTSSALIRT